MDRRNRLLSRRWKPKELISANINKRTETTFAFDNSELHLFPYPETYGEDADIFRLFDHETVHYLRFGDRQIKETASGETTTSRA